jgi:hypothetical protein
MGEHKEIVKKIMRKICGDTLAQMYLNLTHESTLQFLPIDDKRLMAYLIKNRGDSSVEKFINIIKSESNKVQRALIPFLAAKHAPDPDNQPCAAHEWLNDPFCDLNNLKEIAWFLGKSNPGNIKNEAPDDTPEDSQPNPSISII